MFRRAAEVGRGLAAGNEEAGSGCTAVALKQNGMGGESGRPAAARPLREPLPERSVPGSQHRAAMVDGAEGNPHPEPQLSVPFSL